jgi:hypothetical protein
MMKNFNNIKTASSLTALIFLAGCTTNADWGKYRGVPHTHEVINNKKISHDELSSTQSTIEAEAKHLDLSVVNYLHQVNTNKVKRVTAHDLLPDPFLTSVKWKGGVSNVPNAKYIVKLENGQESETLYLSPTLEEAQRYVKKYMPFHDDLYIYHKATGHIIQASGNRFNTGWARFE